MTSPRSLRPPRARKYRVPRGFAGEVRAPLRDVLSIGDRRNRWRFALAALIAVGAHCGLVVLAFVVPKPAPRPPQRLVPVVVAQRLPPPPPPPAPEPPPPEPPRHPVTRARTPKPPAAAQAGKVVARAADPSQPLDMTGFSVATGQSEGFAGGYTASTGTAKHAVTNPEATGHVSTQNLSRAPAPANEDWQCQWPDDQRDSDLNEARVALRVSVDRDGAPERVDVTSAPSPSFAAAARACALQATYLPALDRDGQRVPATTPTFLVHFFR
jgi:outer membrane biosynthesis protein TonB